MDSYFTCSNLPFDAYASSIRFQRGDSRIQECQLHSVGCWWSGQDQAFVEALLSEHTRLVHRSALPHNFFCLVHCHSVKKV